MTDQNEEWMKIYEMRLGDTISGEMVGVSRVKFLEWRRSNGLPANWVPGVRVSDIARYEERKQDWEAGKSDEELSELWGINPRTVVEYRRRHGWLRHEQYEPKVRSYEPGRITSGRLPKHLKHVVKSWNR